ncbi:MAG: hypothetical protein ACK476_17715, partial [Fluviicola sp.]
MDKISFGLNIFSPFSQDLLNINQYSVPVEIGLTDGEHIFKSSPVEVGNYHNLKVFAHITIPYFYDSENQFITIAGVNDNSEKQLSIHTSLEQNTKTSDENFLNEYKLKKTSLNLWTDLNSKNLEFKSMNQTAIKNAISTLVKTFLDAGIQGVIETGGTPIVTPENFNDYKEMFKPEKKDVLSPTIEDIIEVQESVESVYGGTITWPINYSFANVIGSTHDPKPPGYNSWIQLWADTCNNGLRPNYCTSFNYSDGSTPFNCGYDFVGGHVINGTSAYTPVNGSTVYIYPICKAHNNNDNI